jgi:hypothetical protein
VLKKLTKDIPKSKLVEECLKGRDLQNPTTQTCEKIDGDYCSVYPFPAAMWRNGRICPMATHCKYLDKGPTEKVRVGQQKQKKKA